MTIGERIKALRKQNNITQEELAKKLGVFKAAISKYENGSISNIPSDKIEQMASVFGVTPAYLMGWDEEKPEVPAAASIDSPDGYDSLSDEQKEQIQQLINLFNEGNK